MSQESSFDTKPAHFYFSASCFNKAWELIEKADRTAQDDVQMILLAHASLWHWTQREDCTDKNLSIGYWQLSRIYALAGRADSALRYGQLCLDVSQNEQPFYCGYAHEALARAESLAGNRERTAAHLEQARQFVQRVESEDEKKMLLDDLETIQ